MRRGDTCVRSKESVGKCEVREFHSPIVRFRLGGLEADEAAQQPAQPRAVPDLRGEAEGDHGPGERVGLRPRGGLRPGEDRRHRRGRRHRRALRQEEEASGRQV